MKTIFLAAGKSSRIKPISNKNLLNFLGKPLIVHLLKNAQKGGLENFIIVCNKENKTIFEKLLKKEDIKGEFVLQKNLKEGVAGGVAAGLSKVLNDEPVFVLGGNDFVDPNIYKEIIKQSKNIDGAILAKKVSSYFPGGYLEIDNKKIITNIIEKPGIGKEPSDLVNIQAHYFKSSELLKKIINKSNSLKDDVYEIALQELFKKHVFKAVEYNNYWQAIKYPWHILDMKKQLFKTTLKNFISTSAQISTKATLIGDNIFIDDEVKIMNNATICGPCFIGKNTIVGQNTLIRDSNIEKNCVIGFGSEISRSYLNNNVSTHSAYIGDSIIESGVNFGAFSVTTNLRLDKKNIKVLIKKELIDSKKQKLGAIIGKDIQIGSGAKIMPGRKINTNILPNQIIK